MDRPRLAAAGWETGQACPGEAAAAAANTWRRPLPPPHHNPVCTCRLSRAALVCRRWRAVSSMPELVQCVRVRSCNAALPASQSLLRWMQRHGHAVRSLDIEKKTTFRPGDEAEFTSLLHGCLSMCATSLEQLTVFFGLPEPNYTLGSWAAAVHCLEDLKLSSFVTFTAWISLEGLTSLQRLHLEAQQWQLGAAVALPASLTHLHIEGHQAEEMPAQARGRGSKGQCVNRKMAASCFAATGLEWHRLGPADTSLLYRPHLSCRWPPSPTCAALRWILFSTAQPAWPA